MKSGLAILLLIGSIFFILHGYGHAEVEWDVQSTFKIEDSILDVAVTLDGRWIYVLTDRNEIRIYTRDGTLKDKISVDNSIDAIKTGPKADVLFLRSNKTVQVITLDFIRTINVLGSPFKGAAEAPIVIAVFSDFQ